MSDPNDYAAAQAQMAAAAFQKDMNDLTEVGRTRYGSDVFDEASRVFVDKLGNRAVEVLAIASQYDRPDDLIIHLSNNEGELEELTKLPTTRINAAIGRLEGRLTRDGRVGTGHTPLWKEPSQRTGRVSDLEWAKGAASLDDRSWHKEFDRRLRERGGQPRVSNEAQNAMDAARRGRR